ncbi:uncharacterized protein BDCG_17627 [Blastomyces dermatitidis ER-3]|uniref:Uncharacterized protein n=1 Tax=Ajellomyces dermatitidis (strain ER-3 / ATCC MYA-2586) TaxID=559297 RepID=A0ABX2VZI7_AJEDR|nr:uncharacterized protein BDCG_17627 [Blastomyces dermatitidis ER-3]OAT02550.1 hypothetical protein BDCG_17627 [Blastomyces dermatitidis ER-3]
MCPPGPTTTSTVLLSKYEVNQEFWEEERTNEEPRSSGYTLQGPALLQSNQFTNSRTSADAGASNHSCVGMEVRPARAIQMMAT